VAEIIEELRGEVATALGVAPEQVDTSADLTDLGLDSVRLMGVVEGIIARGYDVDYVDLAEDPRLDAWRGLLEA